MFQRLYDRVLSWSAHRHAPAYLSVLSFTESSFFPIPPDVMLIPNRHVDFLKRDIIKAMNKAAALDELIPGLLSEYIEQSG